MLLCLLILLNWRCLSLFLLFLGPGGSDLNGLSAEGCVPALWVRELPG